MTPRSNLYGLYVITDQHLIPRDRFSEAVEAAVSSGATMVQLRQKNTPLEEVAQLGTELLKITRQYGALLIVNDYPTVARDIGANGVHVGRTDPPVAEARAILGPDAIIGASCYGEVSRAVAAERDGADYVAFGTPFPSPTKPRADGKPKQTSLSIFQEAKQQVTVPIFAISGITIDNASQVLEAGADGLSLVSAVFRAPDIAGAARAFVDLFN